MSGNEKKSFLLRYRNCERSIDRVEQELAHWQSRAEWVTASFHETPGGKNGRDQMQTAICQLAELRGELYDRLLRTVGVRREIERAIASVKDTQLRLLLEYRYIDAMTFEEIAERMCYSWRQINNLHNKAIGLIEIAQSVSR